MKLPVYVIDPTVKDEASKVRGVGRYMQLLQDYLPKDVLFVPSHTQVTYESLVIHPFYNFLQPAETLKKYARMQITVIHDLIPHKFPRKFPYGIKGLFHIITNTFLLRNFQGIITDSEHSAKDIHSMVKYPMDGISVVYPCLPKKFLSLVKTRDKDTKSPIKKPYIIYVGDATWNKNLIAIAKAVKEADIDCVFIGKHFIRSKMLHTLENKPENPWLNELHGFYEEIKDDPRFHLAGFVTDEVLVDYYQHALANILVSRDEGFGFSYLEAAACSTPSILGDTSIGREIGADAALYADPDSPYDIAQAIKKMEDKETHNTIVTAMKTNIKRFSPEQFSEGMKHIIERYRPEIKVD